MMKVLKYTALVLLTLLCANLGYAQSLNLSKAANPSWLEVKESKLTRDSIVIGDQVVWNLEFDIPENKDVVFAPYAPVVESYANIQLQGEESLYDNASKLCIVHDFKIDTLSIEDGIKHLNAKVLLTSFDSGYFKLPNPVAVSKDGDTLYFDTPSIEVVNVQVDTANFQIRPLKGQLTYPVTFAEVFPWILLALVIIGLVYLIFRYIKSKREYKDFFGKPIVKDPAHIVALRELENIRNQKLWQEGKDKQYYTAITDTLREYIEERFNVNAMEKTSTEIIDSLKGKDIDKKSFNELDELFKYSDLVKFAKFKPQAAENEEAIIVAVRFVNTTFVQEMELEKEKGEVK